MRSWKGRDWKRCQPREFRNQTTAVGHKVNGSSGSGKPFDPLEPKPGIRRTKIIVIRIGTLAVGVSDKKDGGGTFRRRIRLQPRRPPEDVIVIHGGAEND